MDIVERLRIHETNYVRAGERAIFADARSEIERFRAFIQSLDGKMVCIMGDGDTVIDDGIIVASDILNSEAK